jgi:hypothetical protein
MNTKHFIIIFYLRLWRENRLGHQVRSRSQRRSVGRITELKKETLLTNKVLSWTKEEIQIIFLGLDS